MKKVLSHLPVFACIFVLNISRAKAQENIKPAFTSNVIAESPVRSESSAAVTSKVYADFRNKFHDVANASWTTRDNFSFAYFKQNKIPVRVVYNKNGQLLSVSKYYSGAQVPSAFIELVKKNGYDMTVTQVTEIKRRYATTSFIKMEDKTSYVTVRVDPNGDISMIQSYFKSNL